MSTLRYLNLGCGSKFHGDWVNMDMVSTSPLVRAHNLLSGLPFPDDHFDVIYHSQVLEHIPRDGVLAFLRECRRVLRPGGIMRIVVPDLEGIATEYLRTLRGVIDDPNPRSEADYDWIMLEMYDQTVREERGGQMARVLQEPTLVNEDYVISRIGLVGQGARQEFLQRSTRPNVGLVASLRRAGLRGLNAIRRILLPKAYRVGAFRLGGEVHVWMYDKYSLARSLRQAGFSTSVVKSPTESDIPDWSGFELDVKDGMAFDPASLFMEARK